MEPLFSVEESNKLVLAALPKTCINKRLINFSNYHEEMKSTAVYIPIFQIIPWITQILKEKCNCIYPAEQAIHAPIY